MQEHPLSRLSSSERSPTLPLAFLGGEYSCWEELLKISWYYPQKTETSRKHHHSLTLLMRLAFGAGWYCLSFLLWTRSQGRRKVLASVRVLNLTEETNQLSMGKGNSLKRQKKSLNPAHFHQLPYNSVTDLLLASKGENNQQVNLVCFGKSSKDRFSHSSQSKWLYRSSYKEQSRKFRAIT